jgi:hypothetical protein
MYFLRTLLIQLALLPGGPAARPGEGPFPDAVAVDHPKLLKGRVLPCERIPLGEPDDYKPCIALLPSGELLLTAFHQYQRPGNKVLERTLLFRSKDGGRTWSNPEKLDLLGREPYLTVLKDGTIFLTGHLLAGDVRNRWGYTCGFLHRSTDGGRTWDSVRIESEGMKPKASNHSTRNVLQLDDGTLLWGVDYDGGDGPYLLWRSRDNGRTWDRTGRCQPRDFKSRYGFFGGETWLWQARLGKIWALVRVDSNELPIKGRPIKARNDQADHFILFSSADGGRTFDRTRDLGDYGEMYLSILRLRDKRLLLTFTVRDLAPRLGVRAVPGVETEDGFTFDLSKDRVMLDTRTPPGRSQGGGFGPTVQLEDRTLVTSYSYRGTDDRTHLEVARWKLPPEGANVPAYAWERVTDKAAFAPRDGAGALTFRGRMWLLGGWNPGDKKSFPRICNNEVWSSTDGIDWRCDKPNTFLDRTFDSTRDWEGRHTAGYVVHKDRMWIVGGDVNQGHYHADVWSSANGKDWTWVNQDKPVPWGPRALHYTVVHDGKIWLMGGQTIPPIAGQKEAFYRDVWHTTDGVHWTQVEPKEPFWPQRGMIGGSAVFAGRIWVLGGGTYDTPNRPERQLFNDVWSSADGVRWTQHVARAPWAARQYHEVAVFDGRLWVLEGYSGGNRNDVWHSADGVTWHEVPKTPWKARHAASVFVHDNALWVVAGNNMESDVWKLTRKRK